MAPPSDPVAAMADRVARAEARLDDVTRQRVLGRIHRALDAQVRARQLRGRLLRGAGLALAVAASIAIAWFWSGSMGLPQLFASPRPVAHQPKASVPPLARAVLTPYLVSGTDADRAGQLLAHSHDRLTLAAGERVISWLGDRARVQIVGPAQVVLRALGTDHVELELTQGTLLGVYDHARGGLLSVRSPGAVTRVVGTLFLVAARQGQSRVAVEHGSVRVQRADKLVSLTDAQALTSESDAVVAISGEEQDALREHEQGFVSGAGEQGILGITGPHLRATLEGRALGETPLWVRMPAGPHTVALSAPDGSERRLHANVRPRQQTELVVIEPAAAPPDSKRRPAARRLSPPGATELYRRAEQAMRAADFARASALLTQLVDTHATAPGVDLALYDLAVLALRVRDYGSAQRWLARLSQHGARPALQEPAASLRCRSLGVDTGAASYKACLAELRARFPDSPQLGDSALR